MSKTDEKLLQKKAKKGQNAIPILNNFHKWRYLYTGCLKEQVGIFDP